MDITLDSMLAFCRHHWLSITLIVGVVAAVAFVYRNREQLLRRPN